MVPPHLMGGGQVAVILKFANHALASSKVAGWRAAKTVRASALIPADTAVSVAKIADHQSAGTLLRCHHLETTQDRTPISAAMASLEGHSSMISRNELICDMPDLIGQSVLKRKAILSLDRDLLLGHNVRMVESETETQYKQRFMQRVAEARIASKLKQWQLAEALGMPQDKYKQYEGRSLLPHHLIGRFCIITKVDPVWLVTGRAQKPLKSLEIADTEPEPIVRPKRSRPKRSA